MHRGEEIHNFGLEAFPGNVISEGRPPLWNELGPKIFLKPLFSMFHATMGVNDHFSSFHICDRAAGDEQVGKTA